MTDTVATAWAALSRGACTEALSVLDGACATPAGLAQGRLEEARFLWSRSPLSRVDAIRIPNLVEHGVNDARVKHAGSEQIVAAMRDEGIDHEYLLHPGEGHGLVKPENRLRSAAAAERFLAKHLGGRFEP